MSTNKFMFATGIENSYPTITLADGKIKRIDEMEKTGHYKYWKDDFRLTKEMGIEHLRYGLLIFLCIKALENTTGVLVMRFLTK
jgi:hypothetical protein